ncbi:Hypothetical predicted protein, partial [Marmota monax]
VPLHFGLLGLYYVITVGFLFFLCCKRKVEEHAWKLVRVLRGTAFTYSPLLYRRNKKPHYGIKAAINTGPLPATPRLTIKWTFQIPCGSRTPVNAGTMPSEEAAPRHRPLFPCNLRCWPHSSSSPHPVPEHQSTCPLLIIFQEVPFATPLPMLILPPALDHSAFRPCLHWK